MRNIENSFPIHTFICRPDYSLNFYLATDDLSSANNLYMQFRPRSGLTALIWIQTV